MYSIDFTKQALKALTAMPANARALVRSRIKALAANPSGAQHVEKLVARPGYRLQVGGAGG